MEIRQLISFTKVAELGNLSLAAENLGYSQSAVTIQIRKLEEELGTPLFDRIGHRLIITEEGRHFLSHTRNILTELELAKLSVEPPTELSGILRIGAVESVMMYYVDRVIRVMHELHPKVSVHLFSGTPEEVYTMLDSGSVDLIYVLEKRVTDERWVKAIEKKEEIVFVSSPQRKICSKTDITMEELLKEPLILTERNANYRRAFDHYVSGHHLSVEPFMEISSTQYILQAVTEMNCVSLLPRYVVNDAIKKGRLQELPVRGFSPEMYSQLFYHKEKWKTREMAEFVCIAEEVAGVKAEYSELLQLQY